MPTESILTRNMVIKYYMLDLQFPNHLSQWWGLVIGKVGLLSKPLTFIFRLQLLFISINISASNQLSSHLSPGHLHHLEDSPHPDCWGPPKCCSVVQHSTSSPEPGAASHPFVPVAPSVLWWWQAVEYPCILKQRWFRKIGASSVFSFFSLFLIDNFPLHK